MGLLLTPKTTFKTSATYSPAGEESDTPTSSRTSGNHATSTDTDTGHYDDVVGGPSLHGTGRSRDRRSRSEEAGISTRAHAELAHKVGHLLEDLAQTQSKLEHSQREVDALCEQANRLGSFDVVDHRLPALEQWLSRWRVNLTF